MKTKQLLFALISLLVNSLYGQDTLRNKHENSFGLSMGVGGGLQTEEFDEFFDYYTLSSAEKTNLSVSLNWEHQWSFVTNHSLLFGLDFEHTSFSSAVYFTNREFFSPGSLNIQERTLGDFRNGFFSIDLPLYYAHRIQSKIGTFSPFVGAKLRNVFFIRNSKGIRSGSPVKNNAGDTVYFNPHFITYGMNRLEPIILPTFGLKYSRPLKNGHSINVNVSYQIWIQNSNTVEATIEEYDNYENGWTYVYTDPNSTYVPGVEPITVGGQNVYVLKDEIPTWTPDPVLKIDMSQVRVGISYTF